MVLSGKVDINPYWRSLGDSSVSESTDEILDDGGEWWLGK